MEYRATNKTKLLYFYELWGIHSEELVSEEIAMDGKSKLKKTLAVFSEDWNNSLTLRIIFSIWRWYENWK